jgi:hypothetical protein
MENQLRHKNNYYFRPNSKYPGKRKPPENQILLYRITGVRGQLGKVGVT